MAHVNVTINGREYRMACDDGQEDHLGALARDLDQRIAKLRDDFGHKGDTLLAVMAALLMIDELAETRQRLERVEAEVATLQEERRLATERSHTTNLAVAAALDSAAERVERVARTLDPAVRARDLPSG
jgi:cell division protein ZapA